MFKTQINVELAVRSKEPRKAIPPLVARREFALPFVPCSESRFGFGFSSQPITEQVFWDTNEGQFVIDLTVWCEDWPHANNLAALLETSQGWKVQRN
jgi:hypothetical protein